MTGRAPLSLVVGPALLRPDAQVFTEMLTGWRHQQLARNLRVSTIEGRERTVRRFQAHADLYPWQWQPVHLDEWIGDLRSNRDMARSTVRTLEFSIRWFCDFLCHPAYQGCH